MSRFYLIYTLTILSCILYMIGFFLWIQPWLEIYFPLLTRCPQLERTGYSCIACGMSRDFRLMFDLKMPVHNSFSFLFYIGTLVEMVWRIILLIIRLKVKYYMRLVDYTVHMIAIAIIFLYSIYALLNI